MVRCTGALVHGVVRCTGALVHGVVRCTGARSGGALVHGVVRCTGALVHGVRFQGEVQFEFGPKMSVTFFVPPQNQRSKFPKIKDEGGVGI